MTYQEIITSTKDVLTPADIAPVLGCDPQKIRVQARQIPRTHSSQPSSFGSPS